MTHLDNCWQIIGWWEIRRVPFNLIVGIAGLISGTLCILSGFITEPILGEPIGIPDPPIVAIFGVFAYGFMANICYTAGWLTELFVSNFLHEKAQSFGPILLLLGIIFSIFLTLMIGIGIAGIASYELFQHALGK